MAKQNNTLSILTHLLGLFTGFLGPLIVLLASENKQAKKHSKIVLNWQFSLLIYFAISGVLVLLFIGFFFFAALGIMNTIFSIIGAVRASEGQVWKYPLSIRFFKIKK